MLNIPDSPYERIVIIGAGFAGINLAKRLAKKKYQIVLIDKNNYHQFQPLLYQVAMAGLEPSSISFPIRKMFQKNKNVHIRVTKAEEVFPDQKRLKTDLGEIYFDKLIIATGADTNFFGDKNFTNLTFPLKSISEALSLRNAILTDLEMALTEPDYEERQGYIDIVVVGGGPTGVEMAGGLAEMKKYILPKDYPELNAKEMDIYLFQGGERLLMGMSEASGAEALKCLETLGVKVELKKRVTQFDGKFVYTKDGDKIRAHKVIWAAGIKGNFLKGLEKDQTERGQRLNVDRYNQLQSHKDIFAIGDIASMTSEQYPYGHPQVAQVAIQQGITLSKNIVKGFTSPFEYKDRGSMATIGRHRAVADLLKVKAKGFIAWVMWLFVHLFSLIGFRNKVVVMLNWFWNYMTYDQTLRLIIKAKKLPDTKSDHIS